MGKQPSQFNSDWQKHLDQLPEDQSADFHFIKQFKNVKNHDEKLFEPQNDLFSSPLIEQVFDTENEGQLSLDIFQTDDDLIVKATIAGVDPKHLDISLDNDILTIRGERVQEETSEGEEYFYKECYWGKFSRTIVLPTPVHNDKVKATIKNGILTIKLPRLKKSKSVKIRVKEVE